MLRESGALAMDDHFPPLVSVIIPTRDREEILGECLARLLEQTGPSFEVIVVDSSSTGATQEILDRFPIVRNIRLGDRPWSMVLGRNVGLSHARGEIVAYIDDDCIVRPGWLAALVKEYEDSSVLAAGGRVIYHPWKKVKQGGPVAGLDLTKGSIWAEWDRDIDQTKEVSLLPGGNCSVRKEAALRVGGFDTNYIGSANMEETDFFYRISKLGGRIIFTPFAVVEHRALPRSDGMKRSHTDFVFRYSLVRNRLYFYRKHRAPGLFRATVNQVSQLIAGTLTLLWGAIVFFAASLTGIFGGLFSSRSGKSEGLSACETYQNPDGE